MAERSERKRGTPLGLWFFKTVVNLFGLPVAYRWLHVVCLHYLIFDARARSTGMAYMRRRFPSKGWWGLVRAVYKLFIAQGVVLIDRMYLIAGHGRFDMDVRGRAEMERCLAGGVGFVLLTAHIGSWQVAMTCLDDIGKTVHLLMRPEDNRAMRKALDMYGAGDRVKVILTDGHLGGVVECVRALAAGDIVSIMGDKAFGADVTTVDLLGGKARMPFGAFAIAHAAKCPVVVLLTAKTGLRKYMVDFSNVIRPGSAGRGEKRAELDRCVQEFASILESYVAEYPYQWFVFDDLWHHGVSEVGGRDRAPADG